MKVLRYLFAYLLACAGILSTFAHGIQASAQTVSGPAAASPSGSGVRAPYLGVVTARNRVPTDIVAQNWAWASVEQPLLDRLENPILDFTPCRLTTASAEQCLTGSPTITAWLEYPIGTYTQCGASATAFVAPITSLQCNGVSVPKSAGKVTIWTLQNNPSQGWVWHANFTAGSFSGTRFANGNGSPTWSNPAAALAGGLGGDGGVMYGPIAVRSMTTLPSVLLTCDSRGNGSGIDFPAGGDGTIGELERVVTAAGYGTVNISISASFLSSYISGSHPTANAIAAQLSTHVINCKGINDLNGGASEAQAKTLRDNMAALFVGKEVIDTTLTPNSSTTQFSVSALTRSGSVATVTSTAHGFAVGNQVVISGATPTAYNGIQTIATVPDANTFTFAVTGTPTTPATGTITFTDGWSTTARQNISSGGASRVLPFNALIRNGSRRYIDLGRCVDPYLTGKWPVGPDPAATVGVAHWATPDGLHANRNTNRDIIEYRCSGHVRSVIGR